VVIHETGGPEVLRLEEAERPEPGDDEVLFMVRAASVNPADWKARESRSPDQLPAVLGYDASRTVVESHADRFAEGDDVFGRAASGGYAEFATSPAGSLAKKPAGISHEQAAALPVAGLTAWQALFDRAGLEAGQTALIAGAAGGVGHLALQFAKHARARGPNPEQLGRIAGLVAVGDVRVEIEATLPLAEVRRAHELSESGHTGGKLILIPGA
jgi:NADPH:quinone reductase-like Zn-dependent oxidoreductase